jgi:hypothetical protein
MKNILFKTIMNCDGKGYVKCKYVPTLNKIYFTLFYKQFNTDVHRPIGVTVSNGIDTVEQHKKQKPPLSVNHHRVQANIRGGCKPRGVRFF